MTTLRVGGSLLGPGLLALTVWLMAMPSSVMADVKAFPTAEGFGANAVGGRGGRIIKVTNLNDAGPGSLREAIEATGPRIVVFDVSGTIDTSGLYIREANSYLTIAGQTSPGGIQIKGQGINVSYGGHDVILRHLRIRPGVGTGKEVTNGLYAYGESKKVYNVMFDHVSVEWSSDDSAMFWQWTEETTFQWCLIAEAIDPPKSLTDTGEHAGRKGFIIGGHNGDKTRGTVHHCVLAHNLGRTPNWYRSGLIDWRNNLVYNFGYSSATIGGWYDNDTDRYQGASARGNFVGNVYLPGPNTNPIVSTYPRSWPFALSNGCYVPGSSGCRGIDGILVDNGGTNIYTEGNHSPLCPQGCTQDLNGDGVIDDWDGGFADWDPYSVKPNPDVLDVVPADRNIYRAAQPFPAPPVATHPASQLESVLLAAAGVGATKPYRDAVDTRILGEVATRTGQVPAPNDSPAYYAGGPWPDLAAGAPTPLTDTDGDGMPDSWEQAHGLNPTNASDGPATAANGYTNVENYLNELAGDPVFTSLLPGDLNGDGSRTLIDVRWLIEMLVGTRPQNLATADLTGDGTLALADVQALIKLMVGIP